MPKYGGFYGTRFNTSKPAGRIGAGPTPSLNGLTI